MGNTYRARKTMPKRQSARAGGVAEIWPMQPFPPELRRTTAIWRESATIDHGSLLPIRESVIPKLAVTGL